MLTYDVTFLYYSVNMIVKKPIGEAWPIVSWSERANVFNKKASGFRKNRSPVDAGINIADIINLIVADICWGGSKCVSTYASRTLESISHQWSTKYQFYKQRLINQFVWCSFVNADYSLFFTSSVGEPCRSWAKRLSSLVSFKSAYCCCYVCPVHSTRHLWSGLSYFPCTHHRIVAQ